ncbi:hypothetical protein BZG36_04699 [Bifiguratus adelaidae]|uniref:CigA protein n=1 Tax=Bifiguratus adelaidae TaxID=1938954 RepID=A0A261XV82_9FUNG|nr:hypothetical protein BZG36_04699 [Bifiguratus adelaidae]
MLSARRRRYYVWVGVVGSILIVLQLLYGGSRQEWVASMQAAELHHRSPSDPSITSQRVQELLAQDGGKWNNNLPKRRVPHISPTDKFLAYLPHSGFHNQRIELENALLLANYLDRILLLPDIFLGPAMPWLKFDKLYERLLLQTKRGLEHCFNIPSDSPLPTECLNFFTWTTLPWSFLYDLDALRSKIRIIPRDDVSDEWMYANLGITEGNVEYLRDVTPFDFRVFDDPTSTTLIGKYKERVDLQFLQQKQARVLQFGSLFGTNRVLAQTPEHNDLLKFIRETMIFNNPVLLNIADKIAELLGGNGTYLGVHLRVGDGNFAVDANINVDDIYHTLVDQITDLSADEIDFWEGGTHNRDRQKNLEYEVKRIQRQTIPGFGGIVNPETATAAQGKGLEKRAPLTTDRSLQLVPRPDNTEQCLGPFNDRTKKFTTRIYIGTDAPRPRKNPLLFKFFNTFPCIFTLDDFFDELEPLNYLVNEVDKVPLESSLIPLVDAMVAAKGFAFLGTPASTFSTYIERQLWPIYSGTGIKEVGVKKPQMN